MIRIRPMTDADLPFDLELSRQAGWNQLEADWRRCLDLEAEGCFVALAGDTPAGTTTTCVFGEVAWVAMVLVDPRFRRRGIGRALMEHALAYLDGRGMRSVRLDATPLGQPLYEKLGFVPQFELTRFEGMLPVASAEAPAEVVTVPSQRWDELIALDESVTRTNRGRLLLRLFEERPEDVRAVEDREGWSGLIAARDGAKALYLGPCLGNSGAILLEDAFFRHAGRKIILDVPLGNEAAYRLVNSTGLTASRRLTRMVRGKEIIEEVSRFWASSGPEKG